MLCNCTQKNQAVSYALAQVIFGIPGKQIGLPCIAMAHSFSSSRLGPRTANTHSSTSAEYSERGWLGSHNGCISQSPTPLRTQLGYHMLRRSLDSSRVGKENVKRLDRIKRKFQGTVLWRRMTNELIQNNMNYAARPERG